MLKYQALAPGFALPTFTSNNNNNNNNINNNINNNNINNNNDDNADDNNNNLVPIIRFFDNGAKNSVGGNSCI